MFNPRRITYALVGTVVVALTVGVITTWFPPGPRRLAEDSYSGMIGGHRALFELLEAFDGPVRRHTGLPPDLFDGRRRVLLIEPSFFRLERESTYLAGMKTWVENGGELVVVSDTLGFLESESADRAKHVEWEKVIETGGFLAQLELEGLSISSVERVEKDETGFGYYRTRPIDPVVHCIVRATGALSRPARDVEVVHLCTDPPSHFRGKLVDKADGAIEVSTDSESWVPIALEYSRGKGRVVLVSDPTPFANLGITRGDNAVLAYHLATGENAYELVVDEFYHGRFEEGNWLALLGMYPYGIIALFMLVAVLCWVWSHVIPFGPPWQGGMQSRRSVRAYIEAMARLFWRGRKLPFVLETCREGLLDDLRAELSLGPGAPKETILRRVGRFDPERAKRLDAALDAVAAALARSSSISLRELVRFQEEFQQCRCTMTRHQ